MQKSRILLAGGAAFALLALPVAASAASTRLAATLAGANEPAGGDPDGSGKFSVEVDPDTGDFCYTLSGAGIEAPTAAHVHSGAAGSDGPVVITLQVTGNDNDECVAVEPDTLKTILAAPAGYYVNIHTATYPKGAIRGQLAKAQ